GNLIVEDGKLLLLYREDENWWEVPGGKVEEEESPTEAAVREAEEEIGVEVELRKPFYSGEFQHSGEMFLWHAYVSEIVEGDPVIQEDKFKKLEWFEGSELDELELAPNLEMILPSLRKL
ncbi:MAG: NUDIX domain-containing protein, partial [Candidatus Nanohaloarchaea archaeon]